MMLTVFNSLPLKMAFRICYPLHPVLLSSQRSTHAQLRVIHFTSSDTSRLMLKHSRI